MNFKLWLESNEEEYSNQLTNELCKFIKDNDRLPLAQNTPILGGHTSPAATRIGYNVEITELKLFQHLQELKDHIKFNSDKEILKSHDLENIIEKPMSKEEISRQNVRDLAKFYKDNNGIYPSRRSHIPEERRLGNWLHIKRSSKKGYGHGKIYPGEEEYGISLGLPTNWLDSQTDVVEERNKKISEENVRKLAEFYKKNIRYPSDEEEKELASWLRQKRSSKKGYGHNKIYPGEEEYGISLGLPTNWLDSQADVVEERNKKISEENVRKLAKFYEDHERKYPSKRSHIPEEKELAIWLITKRQAKRGSTLVRTRILYPGEEELGISLGLPTNWLNPRQPKE